MVIKVEAVPSLWCGQRLIHNLHFSRFVFHIGSCRHNIDFLIERNFLQLTRTELLHRHRSHAADSLEYYKIVLESAQVFELYFRIIRKTFFPIFFRSWDKLCSVSLLTQQQLPPILKLQTIGNFWHRLRWC